MTGSSVADKLTVRAKRTTKTFTLDVEFEVAPGITVLYGPSGSGKSSTLGVVSGLTKPDEGRVALGSALWLDTGQHISLPVHKRHVAYVFQSLGLFPHMSALGNVLYGIPEGTAQRNERAHQLLAQFHVAHLADRKPSGFSGGEAQRVALARALAMAPRVVLMDEPFSALDPALRKGLLGVVKETLTALSVPCIFVTHHAGEARILADRVLMFDGGRIVKTGSPQECIPKSEDDR